MRLVQTRILRKCFKVFKCPALLRWYVQVLVMQNRHLKLIDFDAAEYVDPARRKSGSDVVRT